MEIIISIHDKEKNLAIQSNLNPESLRYIIKNNPDMFIDLIDEMESKILAGIDKNENINIS
jgi:hypothetical protein